jgi:hypothetical protein
MKEKGISILPVLVLMNIIKPLKRKMLFHLVLFLFFFIFPLNILLKNYLNGYTKKIKI